MGGGSRKSSGKRVAANSSRSVGTDSDSTSFDRPGIDSIASEFSLCGSSESSGALGHLRGEDTLNRQQLEHILRAAGSITNEAEFVVVGSQAILAAPERPPEVLLVSIEADLYPRHKPELSDLIDGTIGELSPFHQTFGYYGHGVGPKTATVPDGWESRLLAVSNENTHGVTGWCLHPLDIAYSKLAAGRPKDLTYVSSLLEHGLLDESALRELIDGSVDEVAALLMTRLQVCTRPTG